VLHFMSTLTVGFVHSGVMLGFYVFGKSFGRGCVSLFFGLIIAKSAWFL
jgi:hypothetical protein